MFAPTLLHEYLSRTATLYPHKEALICGERRFTYSLIDHQSDIISDALIDIGTKRQDKVVIFLDNVPEAIVSLYGILKAGGVFVLLNGTLKAKKLAHIFKNSEASVLITDTTKAKVVAEAFDDSGVNGKIIWTGNSSAIPKELFPISWTWDSFFSNASCADRDVKLTRITDNSRRCIDVDLAALIYTSGSTGEPKGVMSTHFNMISAARSIIQYLENTEKDVVLNVLPLSFDYGLYQVIMAFMYGGTVILEKSFLYIHKVLERIGPEGVTGFPVVPTVLAMILNLRDIRNYHFDSLRYITNTGAALPAEHIRKFREFFPEVKFYSMFGLTECKRVSYLPPEELDNKPLSVGIPIPNCEVFILDESGQEVAPGVTGELVIRGSNVMQGYWKDPELTAKFYRPGRFAGERLLYSGDDFRRDEEGYLYFLGRRDDMIKSRGERISPKEIENVICQIPGVIESAVVGVPDEIAGQSIKAFLVCDKDANLTEKDILKHCSDNLESFSLPKQIEFLEHLPKTPHGKIDKKALK